MKSNRIKTSLPTSLSEQSCEHKWIPFMLAFLTSSLKWVLVHLVQITNVSSKTDLCFCPVAKKYPCHYLRMSSLLSRHTGEHNLWPKADAWPNEVCHWAKLQLPNRQKAQSVWYESNVNVRLRWASCVEVGLMVLWEVQWRSTIHCRSSKKVVHILGM